MLPNVPGREVAGRIDEVGDEVDPGLIGRRVVSHLGATGGGYAELAVAEASAVHPVPDLLTDEIAVASIGTGRTAAGVLMLTPIGSDDVVVVTAATGGLGALLVREARRQGAWVLALAGGASKVEAARRLGPDAVVDSRSDDVLSAVDAALDGRTPTRVYDGVGGELAAGLHRLLSPTGVLTNYTGLDPDAFGGVAALEAEALARAADGSRVPLVGAAYPLAEAATAHRDLEGRRTVGKVVLDARRPR